MVCENGIFFCFNLFNNTGKYVKIQFFEFFAKCGCEPWVKSLSAFFITTQYWLVPTIARKKKGVCKFQFLLLIG
jgi:hypothetical protein